MVLVPGNTYSIRLTITNITTRGGVLCPAYLYVYLSASGSAPWTNPDPELIGEDFFFGAGETRTIPYSWYIPSDIAGQLYVWAEVYTPYPQRLLASVTRDFRIIQPAVEIVKAYIRTEYPSVSEAYSGWINISPVGPELNLALFGGRIQVGVLLRNPTNAPLKYTLTIYNYHWVEPNNYTTDYLTVPSVEPVAFLPAPTGLPYSNYALECDVFLPPGGELPPGKTGFVYTDLFYQSRRWNYVYIEITSNGYSLGKTLLYWGWYGY